ncbi:hypothetical protein SH1V18_19710 [Vallitalea longa]|uniref:N-acetyltransferase domain-containing protein n=1 Tax=Vallitalea longa TaxID=2936439 RepID=A0A9W6DDX4_9FIRM|nr:GNAT family N-acetyltransferase [Vallitalea longa]GKX29491.1 hypothetical protein SH1V18_19710 [Vallitalea longa]
MFRFDEYYLGYLGINSSNIMKNIIVVKSEYREMPLNGKYLYPIIFVEYNRYIVCSCSYEFFNICKDKFDGTIESIYSIFKVLNQNGNYYRLRKMRKYSIDEITSIKYYTVANTLTEDIIRSLSFNTNINIEDYIIRKKAILLEKRQFVIIKYNRIASTAFISDIYNGGGNIVVFTNDDYKRHGYGKEVVKACINWCVKNNIIPIYLVEESNSSSIKLAESLNLKLKSIEWVISISK